jgi:apolipoprotein N-acyltransferase
MEEPSVPDPLEASPLDARERARRSVALTMQLTLAPLLTGAAALAGWASARRIRGLLPDYPHQGAVAGFTPNAVYQALHRFGAAGLSALLVLALSAAVALGFSRFRWASTALISLCVIHLALLTAVLLAFALSASQLAGALTAACVPGR